MQTAGVAEGLPQTGSCRAAGKQYAREAWTPPINWKSACKTV